MTVDALKLASVPIVDRSIGWQADATATLKAQAAEIAALKETLHNELDGNLRLRELGGARPDECMTTFLERVIAERDNMRTLQVAEAARQWGLVAWVEKNGDLVWHDRAAAIGRNLFVRVEA